MKKNVAILMLVALILTGGVSGLAKTSARKGKARTTQTSRSSRSLSASMFIQKDKRNPHSYYDFKNNLGQILQDLGFEKIFYGKTYDGPGDYDDGGTKRIYESRYVRTQGGKKTVVVVNDIYFNDAVEITDKEMIINFPTNDDAKAFEKSFISLGFRKDGVYKGVTNYQSREEVGIAFSVKGKEIRLYTIAG